MSGRGENFIATRWYWVDENEKGWQMDARLS